MTKLVYLISKTTSFFLSRDFATAESNVFLCLFFLAYITIIVCHRHLFVNFIPKHVNRYSRLIYEANLFKDNFNNFNNFLRILRRSVELGFEFNVTVDSCCMKSNFCILDLYSLAQFTRLNIFKTWTPASTTISISLDSLFWLLFFSMCSYVFLKNEHEKRLKYLHHLKHYTIK